MYRYQMECLYIRYLIDGWVWGRPSKGSDIGLVNERTTHTLEIKRSMEGVISCAAGRRS